MNTFESMVQQEEVSILLREYGPQWRDGIKRLADQNRVSIAYARRAMIVKAIRSIDLSVPSENQPDLDDVNASEKLE